MQEKIFLSFYRNRNRIVVSIFILFINIARSQCTEVLTTGASATVSGQGDTATTNNVAFLDCTGLTSFNVNLNPTITDVNVAVSVTHTWVGDLTLTLNGPAGSVELMQRPRTNSGPIDGAPFGCNRNNINITFDDQAVQTANTLENSCGGPQTWNVSGSYQPTEGLTFFNGTDPTGNWSGTITDGANGDSGNIDSFTVTIAYNTNPSITCPAGGTVARLADVPPPLPTENLTGCSTTGSIVNTATTITGDATVGGTTTYQYTLTDQCGNTATCDQVYNYGPDVTTVITNRCITYRVKGN